MHNYIFIDYENVQNLAFENLNPDAVNILLFIGKQQTKIPVELLKQLKPFNNRWEIIDSVASGKNALDFQIAYHAGKIAQQVPDAALHFISRDKAFDVLVARLKEEKRIASRADLIEALPFLTTKEKADYKTYSLPQRCEHVISRLAKTSRPRKSKTLLSSMNAMFGKQLSEASLQKIFNNLIADGTITIGENEALTYHMEQA